MPKYYIKSGQLKLTIDRKTIKDAIAAAIKYKKRCSLILGPKLCISEIGFESYKLWKCYDTGKFLKK